MTGFEVFIALYSVITGWVFVASLIAAMVCYHNMLYVWENRCIMVAVISVVVWVVIVGTALTIMLLVNIINGSVGS